MTILVRFGMHGPKTNFRNQTFSDGGFGTKILCIRKPPALSSLSKFPNFYKKGYVFEGNAYSCYWICLGLLNYDSVDNVGTSIGNSKKAAPFKKHVGHKTKKIDLAPLPQKRVRSFRVKFSLFLAEFPGDLCIQDCSLNGIPFIQISPPFLILSEFTPCTNSTQSTILEVPEPCLTSLP